jgi:hypothetical protein
MFVSVYDYPDSIITEKPGNDSNPRKYIRLAGNYRFF